MVALADKDQEQEDQAHNIDDDGVQVGGGEGGFEAAHARIQGHAQRDEEASSIDIDARDGIDCEDRGLHHAQ